jgi:hypothetical protein
MRCTPLGEGIRVPSLHTGQVSPWVSSPSVQVATLGVPSGRARQWIFQIIHDAEVLTQARSVSTILVEQTPRVYKADIPNRDFQRQHSNDVIPSELGFENSTGVDVHPSGVVQLGVIQGRQPTREDSFRAADAN